MSSPHSYQLELTEAAENDLEAILNYTALQWGEQQVDVYLAVIEEALQAIRDNPALGTTKYGVSGLLKGYKAGKHIIFYRLVGLKLYVIRILHGSMNYSSHLDVE
jgi:toxin ParE1/3/4